MGCSSVLPLILILIPVGSDFFLNILMRRLEIYWKKEDDKQSSFRYSGIYSIFFSSRFFICIMIPLSLIYLPISLLYCLDSGYYVIYIAFKIQVLGTFCYILYKRKRDRRRSWSHY